MNRRATTRGLKTIRPATDPVSVLWQYCVATPCADRVRGYLKQCPDLAALLPTICERARKEFGPEAELSLDLYRDPEIKDEYLTLCVRQPRYDTAILEGIERVSQARAKRLEQASGYLLLTTDFRSPRGKNAV